MAFKEHKFWARVNKDTTTGCWLWLGATSRGYGTVSRKNALWKAHRLAWVLTNKRDIPDNCILHHTCKNKVCVNPAHLEITTKVHHSDDITAIARNRKLCPRGHMYDYIYPDGHRGCNKCKNLWRKGLLLAQPAT